MRSIVLALPPLLACAVSRPPAAANEKGVNGDEVALVRRFIKFDEDLLGRSENIVDAAESRSNANPCLEVRAELNRARADALRAAGLTDDQSRTHQDPVTTRSNERTLPTLWTLWKSIGKAPTG
jgi:hypothetical protein